MSNSKNIIHATDDTFHSEVLEHEGYVLVDFWAEWCPPCKALEPEIEKVADNNAGKLKVVKVDVEKNMKTAAEYQVMNIPTMMLLTPEKNEEGKRRTVFTMGYKREPAIMAWLKEAGFK